MEQKKSPANYLFYPPSAPAIVDDEIGLREIFRILWKGKWIIILITFLFALGAAFYSIRLPNIYKADALLAPTDGSSSGSLSKIAGQLGGLVALTGVNLGGSESSQADLAMQVMKSRRFIENFVDRHDLLVPLVAAKNWDLVNNKLILDEQIYDPIKAEWLRPPQGLRGAKPSAQEAFQLFTDSFNVTQSKDNSLYTVSVKHYSPYVAQQWVNWLIEDINKVMRERAIAEASQNLAYLNTQLQKTAVADMQNAFYRLIEEQTKSLMLAEVQEEFVFKTIDPAVVSETKDSPKRLLISLLGAMLGAILSLMIVLTRHVFTKGNIISN